MHHIPALWAPAHRGLADRDVLLGYALEAAADFDGESALDRALHHDLTVLLPFGYNPKVHPGECPMHYPGFSWSR